MSFNTETQTFNPPNQNLHNKTEKEKEKNNKGNLIINLSSLVRQHSILSSSLPLIPNLKLREVPVVIALHLEVEDVGLAGGGGGDEVGVEEVEDAGADLGELGLDLGSVVPDEGDVVVVLAPLLLLLDGGDDAPRGAEGPDDVLVRHGEQVALLHRELGGGGGGEDQLLHELDHLLVPLRLLRQLRQVHVLLPA